MMLPEDLGWGEIEDEKRKIRCIPTVSTERLNV